VEVQVASVNSFAPKLFGDLALFISGLGYSRTAFDPLRNQIDAATKDGRSVDKANLEQELIKFAWNTDSMRVAYMLADDLLKSSVADPTRTGNASCARDRTVVVMLAADP
jgi:hypothetical protein